MFFILAILSSLFFISSGARAGSECRHNFQTLAQKLKLQEEKFDIFFKNNSEFKEQLVHKYHKYGGISRPTELIERYKKNELHAIWLVEKLDLVIKDKQVIMPQDPLLLFKKINREIDKLILEGKVEDGYEIRPGIFLSRELAGEIQIYVFRPGIDSIPEGDWKFEGSRVELPMDAYAEALSEGKMPISLHAIDHDLGHLSDFIHYPEIMGPLREAFQRLIINSSSRGHLKQVDYNNKKTLNVYDGRIFFFSELLPLPHYQNELNLKKVVGYWKNESGQRIVNLEENREKFINNVNFELYLKEFLERTELLLSYHGGSIYDSYNRKGRTLMGEGDSKNIYSFIDHVLGALYFSSHELKGSKMPNKRPTTPDDDNLSFVLNAPYETLDALLDEIIVLSKMRENASNGLANIFQNLPGNFEQNELLWAYRILPRPSEEKIEEVLRERLNQFQVAYQNAAALKISMGSMLNESFSLDEKRYQQSSTYLFFKSFINSKRERHFYQSFVEWKDAN